MRFTTVLASAALYFAAGSDAWAQAADGRWIANDRTYWLEGSNVHESCTIRNTNTVLRSGGCVYWTNAQGGQFHGTCTTDPNFGVICLGGRGRAFKA
ncbi:hypothetical protein B0T11DRAFT_129916 [Plectosphaerella cucumerina]|uniref:Uncharacterized protein n=1 Tax=Plectosphaerella cucumerina TaxID=40658 RepID=A0A8K0TBB3_9PEZI|nr:hypothetical protein B0T11DRAFT_129916 [Plectosphaerella cucumerina]